jgi:hypothetical protein
MPGGTEEKRENLGQDSLSPGPKYKAAGVLTASM